MTEPFSVLDREDLCAACCKIALYQDARAEMGLPVSPDDKLCSKCGRLDRARRREQWTFDEAVMGWDELITSAENKSVRVPVKMLLPNGTVVETAGILSTDTHDKHGNKMHVGLYCTLDPKTVVFVATAHEYPLRTESDETIIALPRDVDLLGDDYFAREKD